MAEPQRGMIRKCRGPLEIIPGGSKSGYGEAPLYLPRGKRR